jgi:hypothetical protein
MLYKMPPSRVPRGREKPQPLAAGAKLADCYNAAYSMTGWPVARSGRKPGNGPAILLGCVTAGIRWSSPAIADWQQDAKDQITSTGHAQEAQQRFTLILLAGTYSVGGTVVLPGYESDVACMGAGAALVTEAKATLQTETWRYMCVAAPR